MTHQTHRSHDKVSLMCLRTLRPFGRGAPSFAADSPSRSLAAFALACVFALASATGCKSNASEASAAMGNSVVQIRTTHGRGTGFVIQSNGRLLVATAAHVIADGSDAMILREQQVGPDKVFRTIYPDARFIAIDFERDLALLEVPNLPNGALTPLSMDASGCESATIGYGYPPTVFTATQEQGLTPTTLTGVKRVQLDAEERLGGRARTLARGSIDGIVFTPALEPGNSGGPVLSSAGDIVGVTVMKSNLHAQGAAVCVKHLEDLIAASKSETPVDGEAVARFVTDVVNGFLPFADDTDSPRAARDFILPSVLERANETYRQYIGLYFSAANTSAGRARSLKKAFDTTFPGTSKSIETLGSRCIDEKSVDIECLADVAALPMALGLLRAEVKGESGVREITSQGDPKRIGQIPPEYDAALLFATVAKTESVRLRLRLDYGRLWIVPRDPMKAFEESLAASKEDSTPFVGRWSNESLTNDEGICTHTLFNLVIEQQGTAFDAAQETRTLAIGPSPSSCSGTTRIAGSAGTSLTGEVVGEALALRRTAVELGGDFLRCPEISTAYESMMLKLDGAGRLVVTSVDGKPQNNSVVYDRVDK